VGALIGALGPGNRRPWYLLWGQSNWQTDGIHLAAFSQIGQGARPPLKTREPVQNRPAVQPAHAVMAVTVFLLATAGHHLPPLQSFFSTQPLSAVDLLVVMASGVIVFAGVEIA